MYQVIPSNMRDEINQIPDVVDSLLRKNSPLIESAAEELRKLQPVAIVTIARGSSDHAAHFFKYACEIKLGLPVSSIGPSVVSIYGAQLKLANMACLAISQSGRSPDIISMTQAASKAGATCLAITNDPASPLAQAVAHSLPISAGVEHSVAATKTFLASATAGLLLLAYWNADSALIQAIQALPDQLASAAAADWKELADHLEDKHSLYVLGRGPSYPIACEAALKFKETCQIHGESFSGAEVLHGPVSIVDQDHPVLVLVSHDAAEESLADAADQLAGHGGAVFATSDKVKQAAKLPKVATNNSLTDPLSLIVSFYSFVERLATLRGIDPDRPRNLKKVTQTV